MQWHDVTRKILGGQAKFWWGSGPPWHPPSSAPGEHDLYCCLLPRCEALRTCRTGFPIATAVLLLFLAYDFFETWNYVAYNNTHVCLCIQAISVSHL